MGGFSSSSEAIEEKRNRGRKEQDEWKRKKQGSLKERRQEKQKMHKGSWGRNKKIEEERKK